MYHRQNAYRLTRHLGRIRTDLPDIQIEYLQTGQISRQTTKQVYQIAEIDSEVDGFGYTVYFGEQIQADCVKCD